MNERIKELFEQAHITTTRQVIKGGWDNDRPPYEMVSKTTTEFDPEVFAQLIVESVLDEVTEWTGMGDRNWSDELDRRWIQLEFGYGELHNAKIRGKS